MKTEGIKQQVTFVDHQKISFKDHLILHKVITEEDWDDMPSMMDILIEKKKM